jgi:hypothetical protein
VSAKARLSRTESSPASQLQIGGGASGGTADAWQSQERSGSAATWWACSPGRRRCSRRGAVQLEQRLGTCTSQEEVQPATIGGPWECRYGYGYWPRSGLVSASQRGHPLASTAYQAVSVASG